MDNLPVEGAYDPTSGNCYFSPVPLTPNLEVKGISSSLDKIEGFPPLTASGGMGLCKGSRQIFVATDLGKNWVNDVTVLDINTTTLDYTFDVPSLSGKPSSAPLDFVVNENTLEVWMTLYNEDQVAVFFADDPSPDITRITLPDTCPTTLAIDQTNYKVFVACDGHDTIAVVDGFSHSVTSFDSATPLTGIDPLPAMVGMAYVPPLNRLYVATLLAGKVDYYDVATGDHEGSIQVAPQNTEIITGLVYHQPSGLLFVTGQAVTTSVKGHIYTIDVNENKVVATTTTSAYNPSFPCIDPTTKRLFVPDPGGLVDVFKINAG